MSVDFGFMDKIVALHADEFVEPGNLLPFAVELTLAQYGCCCSALRSLDESQ
jgi:hypothetical protein